MCIRDRLLALVMALSLAACAVQPRQEDYQSVNIRLGGLKGPTSMGMAKLLDDAENGLTANTYESVSYTHLDVYKRQRQYCVPLPPLR